MFSHDFDFLELGQAIQNAHEKQRITREELAEELGIFARCSLVHRLCVLASGSLMTVTCKSFASIKLSCLHLGQ